LPDTSKPSCGRRTMAENKTAKTPTDSGTGFIDGVWYGPGPTAWQCQCGKAYTVTCISSKPAKQWVSLTDEEVWNAIDDVLEGGGWLDVARVLEAAIKRKNT
jgi:hypothetical protein